VDEEHVWSVGAFGHLSCINRSTHEVDWITNIIEDFDVDMPMFGIAQSPLIYEDLVIVAPQGKKAGLVAYDKRSGELRWATRKLMGQPWMVSPIAATFGGTDQIVMTSPYDRENEQFSNEVISVDASNGEILWIYTGLYSFATIASPKVIDDTRLFLTCGSYNGNYRPVSIMLDVRRSGGEFAITELFKTEEAGSKIHAAVRHGDYLYLNSGDRGEAMTCMSLDGEVVWQGPGFHLGGPILVGDLIMNQHGKSGDVYLIEATPNGYNELGHAELSSRGKNTPWGPLAFSDGKLLVRHSSELICLDLTGAK
jgi:outer membrane protein assembly factor BamB